MLEGEWKAAEFGTPETSRGLRICDEVWIGKHPIRGLLQADPERVSNEELRLFELLAISRPPCSFRYGVDGKSGLRDATGYVSLAFAKTITDAIMAWTGITRAKYQRPRGRRPNRLTREHKSLCERQQCRGVRGLA